MDDMPHKIFPAEDPEAIRDPRFVVLREKHIGIGLRWMTDAYMPYPLHLSLAMPFFTLEIGLGPWRFGPTVTLKP